MKLNPQLLREVKRHFARKSTEQLNNIIQGEPAGRWSVEAQEAANSLLADRAAGRASEPATPDYEDLLEPVVDPKIHFEADEVAVGLLAGLLTGYFIIPYTTRVEAEEIDLPQPFGRSMAWMALETTDTLAVARQLGLREATETTWYDGLFAAHRGQVFISPPVGEWTLVVSTCFFQPPQSAAQNITQLLARFQHNVSDVQYFCNLPEIGLYVWSRVRHGMERRGYGWLQAEQSTVWNEGQPTDEEEMLGMQFINNECPQVPAENPDSWQPMNVDDLFRLASLWSIDPMGLNEELLEPMPGILGQWN